MCQYWWKQKALDNKSLDVINLLRYEFGDEKIDGGKFFPPLFHYLKTCM